MRPLLTAVVLVTLACSESPSTHSPSAGTVSAEGSLVSRIDPGSLVTIELSFEPRGMNDLGTVVGQDASTWQAVTWADGSTRRLPLLGVALDVNNLGAVVGVDTDRGAAFLWTEGEGTIALPELEPGLGSEAVALNDLGQVAGSSRVRRITDDGKQDVPEQAVLWEDGAVRALAPGWYRSRALDVNNLGVAVGDVGRTRTEFIPAFFLPDGSVVTVSLDELAFGYSFAELSGINDLGDAMGVVDPATGLRRFFVVESGSASLLAPTLHDENAKCVSLALPHGAAAADLSTNGVAGGTLPSLLPTSSCGFVPTLWSASTGYLSPAEQYGALTDVSEPLSGEQWAVGVVRTTTGRGGRLWRYAVVEPSASELVAALDETIAELEAAAPDMGPIRALRATTGALARALAAGDETAARRLLAVLRHRIERLVRQGRLTSGGADRLVQAIARIELALDEGSG